MTRGKRIFSALAAAGLLTVITLGAPDNAAAQSGGWLGDPFAGSNANATSSSGGGFFSFVGGASGRQTGAFSKRHAPGQIIVSFGDRRLYHVIRRGYAVSYPIAVPRANMRWSGALRVSQKRVNPRWTPTPRMRRENPRLPPYVPGGHKRNPLGVRALYLGSSMYRIHGTDAPWTIGKAVSSGCIRMHNSHVLELYAKVRVGTRVVATWKKYRS